MAVQQIAVLRYGHRAVRDCRVTSHCCLVARAFGARGIIIAGDKDENLLKSAEGVALRWGGHFKVSFTDSWRKTVNSHKKKGFFVVHLTMYGLPLQREIGKLRKKRKVLAIIGGQKVEGDVYRQSDANVAVTGQPHSEIAALAVLLDWLQNGRELGKNFAGAGIAVKPTARGKKVVKLRKK